MIRAMDWKRMWRRPRLGGLLLRLPLWVYLALLLYGWLGSERQIFVPQTPSYRDGDRVLKIEVERGERIAALWLTNATARYTVLYSHGNAEDIGLLRFDYADLARNGFNVLGYDYRGYGRSDGTPSERNAYRDIDAAYRYLINHLGIAPSNIILFGRSVGAGPSVDLAAREPVGGLVIQSGFTSAFRVMTRVKIAPFDRFDNLAKIPRVKCPILIFHGTADEVIPFSHGEALRDAARTSVEFVPVPGAGHNDLVDVAGSSFLLKVQDFASRWVGTPRSEPEAP